MVFWSKGNLKGFTLIEIIVVVAIISILAGTIAPFAARELIRAREEKTLEEIEHIYEAIIGNPEEGTYGYLGDMGVIPAGVEMLGRQNQDPTGPAYNFVAGPPVKWRQPSPTDITIGASTVGQVGWRGPYLSLQYSADNEALDSFGTRYRLDADGDGLGDFQVISAGPNRVFGDSDDIVYPDIGIATQDDTSVRWIEGNLSLSFYVNDIVVDDTTTSYILYFADKGALDQTNTALNTSSNPLTPSNVFCRYGLHPVRIDIGNQIFSFKIPVLANKDIFKEFYRTVSTTGQTPDAAASLTLSCTPQPGGDWYITLAWPPVTRNDDNTTLLNLAYYQIQHRLAPAAWETIGSVGPNTTQFTYYTATAGNHRFRVRTYNYDGNQKTRANNINSCP